MKSTSLFITFALFMQCILGDDLDRCPEALRDHRQTRLFGDMCYLFVDEEVQGDAAYDRCRAIGGQPVEVPDAATNNFLVQNIRTMTGFRYKNGIWIGLTDNSDMTGGTGKWTWLASGRQLEGTDGFQQWAEDEPSTGFFSLDHANDCAQMRRRGDPGPSATYEWVDKNCHLHTYNYICQAHMAPRTTTTTTTTTTTRPPTTTTTTTTTTTATTTTSTTTPPQTEKITPIIVVPGDKVPIIKTADPADKTDLEGNNRISIHAAKVAHVKGSGSDGQGGGDGTEDGTNQSAVGLGIGIGVGIAVVLIVVLFVVMCRRRRKKKHVEETVVTFHNGQYAAGHSDIDVYTDVDENQYQVMGSVVGAEAPPLPPLNANTYSNCSLPKNENLSNKKREEVESQQPLRAENQYEVPSVSHYATPSTPPPTYYPPGLPPPYAEVSDEPLEQPAAAAAPTMVTNELYGLEDANVENKLNNK